MEIIVSYGYHVIVKGYFLSLYKGSEMGILLQAHFKEFLRGLLSNFCRIWKCSFDFALISKDRPNFAQH